MKKEIMATIEERANLYVRNVRASIPPRVYLMIGPATPQIIVAVRIAK